MGGWIVNAHLMDETTTAIIEAGYQFGRRLVEASGLPLICITAPYALAAAVVPSVGKCPVLSIRRQLVPPWQRADSVGEF
jgi:hypothetical protein